jgi:FAD/FMN-containing dehydrogenase
MMQRMTHKRPMIEPSIQPVSSEQLAQLQQSFSGRLLTGAEEMAPFLLDWRKRWQGKALAVAQPDTAADVAQVVRWCHTHCVAVVAQGGNTGLSGGAIPDQSGHSIVLSLARLTRVRALDPINNTITVEAGCILASVQEAARVANRLFPLSLAAEGSCTIGGNLSTNAGGTGVLRYGNARELCLGIEAVTPQGELWNGLRGLRKDNTGYDLRDLFIGAEGTLGIITAAVLKLFPLPKAQVVSFIAVQTPQQALELLQLAQGRLGAALTAFELVSDFCLQLVLRHFPACQAPLDAASPWYVLLEVSDLIDASRATDATQTVLEEACASALIIDAAVSRSLAQAQALWALRENISQAQALEGKNIKHDIAVPISRIAEFVTETSAAILQAFPGVRMVVFGHLGDGNLHFNVAPPPGISGDDFLGRQDAMNRLTHDTVARYNGSISAEHGLGVLRRDEAARYKAPVETALMRAIKDAIDPLGIMNPGKVLSAP